MRATSFYALLAAFGAPAVAGAAPVPAYAVATSIAGPDGPWDYARTDDDGAHLYIARGNSVTVIDLATGAVSSLGSVQRGHAVVPLPGNTLLVTSGNDGTVRVFDTVGKTELTSIAVGKKPDAAILNPAKTQAFVMNATSGTVSVIDLATAKVVKTIPVKPALEFAAVGSDGMVYINNEGANEIDTVDTGRGIAGKPIALPGCEGPTGLGYDKAHNRLISSCGNGKAAIVDLGTQTLTDLIPIGSGADAVIMDEARGLAFIPCGQTGVLDVLSLSGAKVTHAATVATEVGARTGALDPRTGTLYLPTAKFGPPATAGGRPPMVPGSFHVLVVRRGAAS